MPQTPQKFPLPSFTALQAYLDGLGLFRMTPGLDRIIAVLENLGLRRPPFAVVQVAGTNGKGSTSSMLAALAQAHGLRTGLHTSPHFLSVRERIRVNGRMLPEAQWLELGNRLLAAGGETLSYFEFVTSLAVMAFAAKDVELAVMETGLGGSFDATTALDADLVLLTPFGLDHQAVLGSSLTEIARDKAGAIRGNKPVYSAPQPLEAQREILHAAQERHAPLRWVKPAKGATLTPLDMRLTGEHQKLNAALALAGWRHLATAYGRNRDLPDSARPRKQAQTAIAESFQGLSEQERMGLASAWLPGRMQSIPPHASGPAILLDGAHNKHAFEALSRTLETQGTTPVAAIFACLEDKDPRELLPLLRGIVSGPVYVPPIEDNPRAMDPQALASLIGAQAEPVRSMRAAMDKAAAHMERECPASFMPGAESSPLLICGSLYLLGQFFALYPEHLEGD
jgi:dihydrofolate synthase/folylpolyglutamate synthase